MNARTPELRHLAGQLHRYIRHRAGVEGVGYMLSAKWWEDRIREVPFHGTTRYFGVVVRNGHMLRDEQEPYPGFFEEWRRSSSSP